MRVAALVGLLIVPGAIGVLVFGISALIDWGVLQQAYAQYAAATRGGDLRAITIAEATQNIHRINLLAEGVWTLLSAILAGIGVHGLCVMPQRG